MHIYKKKSTAKKAQRKGYGIRKIKKGYKLFRRKR